MNTITKFWFDYLVAGLGETQPTQQILTQEQDFAENIVASTEVPYLFPQYLLTEVNNTTCLEYATAYFEETFNCGTRRTEVQMLSVPDEFREYLELAVEKILIPG